MWPSHSLGVSLFVCLLRVLNLVDDPGLSHASIINLIASATRPLIFPLNQVTFTGSGNKSVDTSLRGTSFNQRQ